MSVPGAARAHQHTGVGEVDSALDFVHLAKYTLGKRDLEIEILGLFAAQTDKSIAELECAVNEREWRVAAHTLKGSCRAVGALQLARLAEDAERLGGVSDRAAAARITAAMRAAEKAANAAIADRYSN